MTKEKPEPGVLFPFDIGGSLVGHSSFLHCRRVTTQANSSFPLAFRLLPRAQRRAMDALYAFMRVTDDLADEPGDPAVKRAQLAAWRAALDAALAGKFTHPVFPALAHTVRTFGVPPRYLHDVIDGVEADIEPVRYSSFAELYPYCYRVASAVGLACVRVWGFRDGVTPAEADAPAEAAGIAFQLTNILRDLGEDLTRGRVYLPASTNLPTSGARRNRGATPAFRELMRFQVEPCPRLTTIEVRRWSRMLRPERSGDLRRDVRHRIGRSSTRSKRRDYDVFTRRVRLLKWRKVA